MVGKEDPSWAKRQARTSLNFPTDSLFWLLVTGGLNIQSLHHVCPVIGSSHLVDIYPQYKKICEKHGVNLMESKNLLTFFAGFLSGIRAVEEGPHSLEAVSACVR